MPAMTASGLIKTSAQLTPEQAEQLAALAERRGCSVAFLIREAIDTWLATQRAAKGGRDERAG